MVKAGPKSKYKYFPDLIYLAYLKTTTAKIYANGFHKSRIFLSNRNIVSDHDFLIATQKERTPPADEAQNNFEFPEQTVQEKIEIKPLRED